MTSPPTCEPIAGPGGTTRLTLYVDVLQRAPAGVVLAGLTPAMAGDPPGDETAAREPRPTRRDRVRPGDRPDDDAAFAALVEAFHRTPGERTWPDAEDLPAAAPAVPPAAEPGAPKTACRRTPCSRRSRRCRRGGGQEVRSRIRRSTAVARSRRLTRAGGRPSTSVDDPGRRGALRPAAACPAGAAAVRHALGAVSACCIGLALLLVPTLLDFGHRTSLDIAGVVFVLGSGAVLISRLRDRSPDDPDDGAVV